MHTIGTKTIQAVILDPLQDRERFGTRYCTGGYIFQVRDTERGDLLTGPTYPDSFNVFDGQGIPDTFSNMPLRDKGSAGSEALIPGIGPCSLADNKVLEFCTWQIDKGADHLDMTTSHAFQSISMTLRRRVDILNRTIRSRTWLRNTGKAMFQICWYPHPFFPQPSGDELCAFSPAVTMPANNGYAMGENGFIRRLNSPETEGRFQALTCSVSHNLTVLQRHDVLGLVGAGCDFASAAFPIWGNPRTFSWEPYLNRSCFPGTETMWTMDYHF